VPEYDALHANEWEHAREFARLGARRKVVALVPEDFLDEPLPRESVKVRVTALASRECVPFIRSRSVRPYMNVHALFSVSWSRFRVLAKLVITMMLNVERS
jgi:hypothetical protein